MFYPRLGSIAVALAAGVIATSAADAARLRAPAAGIDVQTADSLNAGPWQYWSDSDTVAIAGHRTTHSAPFRNLNLLSRGDAIFLGKSKFTVSRKILVRPWQTWVLNWKGLVLSACSRSDGSPTSLNYRIVILAKEAK